MVMGNRTRRMGRCKTKVATLIRDWFWPSTYRWSGNIEILHCYGWRGRFEIAK